MYIGFWGDFSKNSYYAQDCFMDQGLGMFDQERIDGCGGVRTFIKYEDIYMKNYRDVKFRKSENFQYFQNFIFEERAIL